MLLPFTNKSNSLSLLRTSYKYTKPEESKSILVVEQDIKSKTFDKTSIENQTPTYVCRACLII